MAKSIFHSYNFIIYFSIGCALVYSSVGIFILIFLILLDSKNIFIGCRDRVDNLLTRIKIIGTEKRGSLWKSHWRISKVWLNWLKQIFIHSTILTRHSDCELRFCLHKVVEAWLWNINISLVSKLLWRSIDRFLFTYNLISRNLLAKEIGCCFNCSWCHFNFKIIFINLKTFLY